MLPILLLFRKAVVDCSDWVSTLEQETDALRGQMTSLPDCTIFLSEVGGGGDLSLQDMLVCGDLCKAVWSKGGIKQGRGESKTFWCQHHFISYSINLPNQQHLCLFCLHMSVHLFLSIFPFLSLLWYILSLSCMPTLLSSSIWPQPLCASFPMWSYASHTYCLCTACTLISCNMVLCHRLFRHIIPYYSVWLFLCKWYRPFFRWHKAGIFLNFL